ncbi:MAG TPA: hypothetical protein VFU49_24200, partial [Ktedonobacteraceae bacterium]|nr:hypothetical protein [Ktedonobacteraceae bacterium]
LIGLRPATWYSYQVGGVEQAVSSSPAEKILTQCFRTLDLPNGEKSWRLAYGSCRKLSAVEPDALNALGPWLMHNFDERETIWPRLLLLIGDQIYADDRINDSVLSFEDFARKYTEAWSDDAGIRQALAVLPTYMIFDDHEITNSWNIAPAWRAWALQQGLEQTLVDGLVAYWVYQGWGNIALQSPDEHDLLALMQQAEQSGEDILEALRARVRQTVYEEKLLDWHYTIPTMPPLFVADVRADRPATLNDKKLAGDAPRIMSQRQMEHLRTWVQEHDTSIALLISSVPALLPPLIGFAEYVTGVRPLQRRSSGILYRLGRLLANRQQKLALRMSFEHWPAFGATWRELVGLLALRRRDLVILSGDVHFSYAIKAYRVRSSGKRRTALYQLVASPFRNVLEQRDKSLVLGQAWIKRAIYGGLSMKMLPLQDAKSPERIPSALLFQNVVSLVAFSPCGDDAGMYCIQQTYLGVKQQILDELASTSL